MPMKLNPSRTAALPEVAWPILQALRKLAKTDSGVKSELSQLIQNLDKSVLEVKEKRIAGSDALFQLGFDETSVGKHWLKLASKEPKKFLIAEQPEEEEEEGEEQDASEESEQETKEERSKRSIKRERQKEKKRTKTVQAVVARTVRQVGKIDMTSQVTPFPFSDDEE